MSKTFRSLFIGIFVFVFLNSSFGQEKTIQGVVVDELSKEPVSFANISIKNAAAGTTTDATGKFKINIAEKNQAVFFVSHINYQKKKL